MILAQQLLKVRNIFVIQLSVVATRHVVRYLQESYEYIKFTL